MNSTQETTSARIIGNKCVPIRSSWFLESRLNSLTSAIIRFSRSEAKGRPLPGTRQWQFTALGASLIACVSYLSSEGTVLARAAECADLALVMAVDTSSSIDVVEFAFQKYAVIAALQDEEVSDALSLAGTVDISVMYWADPASPIQETGFYRIRNRDDAVRLVNAVTNMPRLAVGNTGLSTGLNAALDRLETICAHRRVINVSGDGEESVVPRRRAPRPGLKAVRTRAAAENVTINALVVGNSEPDLAEYFEKHVIVGEDAFVMEVAQFDDYASALRRKLIREISPAATSMNKDSSTGQYASLAE